MRALTLATLIGGCAADVMWSGDASSNFQQVWRDSNVAGHTLVSDDPSVMQRYVVAFPSLNSGAVLAFSSADSSTSGFAVRKGTTSPGLIGSTDSFGNQVLSQQIEITGEALLYQAVLGGVRAVRDFVEPSVPVLHYDIDYVITDATAPDSLNITRTFYNPDNEMVVTLESADTSNKIIFTQIPCTTCTNGLYNYTLAATTTYPAVLKVTATLKATKMTAMDATSIFDSQTLAQDPNALKMSFLAYKEKFTAGSWRFLTYFGRDTLFTGYLMMDVLTTDAVESILSGAIQRIDTTGTAYPDCDCQWSQCNCTSTGFICHEETVGDYSGWQRNQSGAVSADPDAMQCDYKMVDTDFLVVIVLGKYAAGKGKDRVTTFLQSTVPSDFAINPSATYATLMNRNVQHIMDMGERYYKSGSFKDLVRIRHPTVGNWRDSDQGLGGGVYPYDVNVAMMPAALRAIQTMSHNGVIDGSFATNADLYASKWEKNSYKFFEVNYDQTTLENRIEAYANMFGYSTSLERSDPKDLPSKFYALSLMDDGTQVQFMHTDVAMALLLRDDANLPDDTCYYFARSLTTQFPRGLDANVGPVVLNPAFGWGNTETQEVAAQLDNRAYHGTVVWQFQTVMAYEAMWKWYNLDVSHEINEATDHAMNTLWSEMQPNTGVEMYSIVFNSSDGSFWQEDLNVVANGGTESDAIQLWSYSNLGLSSPPSYSGISQNIVSSTAVVGAIFALCMMLVI